MRQQRRQRKAMAQMNVVPYIDVMLVLLVIFMVTAPMLQSGVQVDMPKVSASPLASDNQQEPFIISVDQRGNYFLADGSALGADNLAEQLAAQIASKEVQPPVYIRADKSVEYRYLMDVMVAAQQAGVRTIGLVSAPPAEVQ